MTMKKKSDSTHEDVLEINTASVTVSSVVDRTTDRVGNRQSMLVLSEMPPSPSSHDNSMHFFTQPSSVPCSSLSHSQIDWSDTQPKSQWYTETTDRLQTFTHWPNDSHQTPESLAEAGLYYQGYVDCVKCFHCGGKLRGWEKEDHPWVEHAKWFPSCHFVIQKKGHHFTNVVQKLTKRSDKITYQMVLNEMRKSQ
ncbi:Baculoviral IAP repeat-containing protein 7-A [Bulinus truncatus]|nr:Baculoviral IAP repeat-containing protein 7-A [Bulinus truncatus]